MKKFLTLFILIFFQLSYSQQVEILKIKKYKVATLSDSLRETSGLHFFKDKLLTFNDSGNTSEIFQIDKNSGKILKIFKTNLPNKDWEAITSDEKNLYIGDFGNNAGTRKDLKIYKIPFVDDTLQIDSIKTINYFYPEQTDFSSKNLQNDYDAEAMIFLEGKIHLFTKSWASKVVSHYVINSESVENQPAEKIETHKTNFVITDASYFDKKLYLIGYNKKTEVYLEIFDEAEYGFFFKQEPLKFFLGSALKISQIEGITVNEDGIYISGEKMKSPLGTKAQSFYFIPFDKLKFSKNNSHKKN